jgi:hypothetical protein
MLTDSHSGQPNRASEWTALPATRKCVTVLESEGHAGTWPSTSMLVAQRRDKPLSHGDGRICLRARDLLVPLRFDFVDERLQLVDRRTRVPASCIGHCRLELRLRSQGKGSGAPSLPSTRGEGQGVRFFSSRVVCAGRRHLDLFSQKRAKNAAPDIMVIRRDKVPPCLCKMLNRGGFPP